VLDVGVVAVVYSLNVSPGPDREADVNVYGDVRLDSRDVGMSVDVASAIVEFEDLPCLRTPISLLFFLLLFVEKLGWRRLVSWLIRLTFSVLYTYKIVC